jgi:unsaturated rhamnogalacturonyl hydrolase
LHFIPVARYPPLLKAYTSFAGAWVKSQDESGLWHQLMDDPTTFLSTTATGFGLHALATGVAMGALPAETFAGPVAAAWRALAAEVQDDGYVTNMSPGFGILGTRAECVTNATPPQCLIMLSVLRRVRWQLVLTPQPAA